MRRSIEGVEQSAEFRADHVLARVSSLVESGVITDPVVSAYLLSLQQRRDSGQLMDSMTMAQFESLAEALENVPDR
jgi:hypothetical protein